ALGILSGVEHMIVEHVAVDVLLDLPAQLVGDPLVVEPEAHRVVQDRGDRGLHALDRGVAVAVERGARREPDVDAGGIAAGLARARVDARDRVLDHLGQEAGARDHAVPDAAAQVQHAWTLGADRDRNPRTDRTAGPPDALRAGLIGRLA